MSHQHGTHRNVTLTCRAVAAVAPASELSSTTKNPHLWPSCYRATMAPKAAHAKAKPAAKPKAKRRYRQRAEGSRVAPPGIVTINTNRQIAHSVDVQVAWSSVHAVHTPVMCLMLLCVRIGVQGHACDLKTALASPAVSQRRPLRGVVNGQQVLHTRLRARLLRKM
jgi:hypothetical protein